MPREAAGVSMIWLFHLTAIVGAVIGFKEFFITKTALNLVLVFSLLVWVFKIDEAKKWYSIAAIFAMGMTSEILGVNFGFLFGEYEYGENLGLKLLGVPLTIGLNWVVLVLITGTMSNYFKLPRIYKALIGAGLMLGLDFIIEVVAPLVDYWEFNGGVAPLQNYVAWFIIAFFMHMIWQRIEVRGSFRFSMHLYACLIIFFSFFAFYGQF